jgi:hypothetical protein
MRKLILPVILFGSLVLASAALAGPNANAKILLNVRASSTHNTNPCSDPSSAPSGCNTINTSGKVTPINSFGQYVYLLVEEAAGVSALDCGISFTGSDPSFFTWYLCADADTTTNGWTSGGNRISWDTCQLGTVVCAGYFYVGAYAPCRLEVVADPVDNRATVIDCANNTDIVSGLHVSHLGYANFSVGGTVPGYNPCGLNTPVMNSTWSSIKLNYGH